jgi:hypothetical protein
MKEFTGVKVFTTTLARDREAMGEAVRRWLAEHPELEVVDKDVRQSSDRAFHCLSIVVYTRERPLPSPAPRGGGDPGTREGV